MSNPNNIPVAPGGWGFINDPPEANVPEGARGVDPHGNRIVTLADGEVSTESMGSGATHGIPNGDWNVSPVEVALGPLDCDDPDAQAKALAEMQQEVADAASKPPVTFTPIDPAPTPEAPAAVEATPAAPPVPATPEPLQPIDNNTPIVRLHGTEHTGARHMILEVVRLVEKEGQIIGQDVERIVVHTYEQALAAIENVYRRFHKQGK